ncbi:stage II sporulation protein E [Thermosediminibacter litoriperuensis]|uniref:Stage II sporulation protein E n=1 Tax=Thermosediminibacter litoriperuensis TaxID=291989 RepID=A0A5S5AYL9_9FIRM|nr:stage II sporulation protein E [Thermosediminibacter litoriperuensis]TYP58732.1 stage II sporulation protein E [Thermosediminibacter litoriperuensis]
MINKTRLNRPGLAVPPVSLTPDSFLIHIIAFIFGRAPVMGIYPLGISITAAAALYRGRFFSIGLAALFGTLTATRDFTAIRYAASIILFTAIYYMLENRVANKDLLIGGSILASLTAPGLLIFSIKGTSLYDYILVFLEAALALVMTYIIPFGLPGVFRTRTTRIEKSLCLILITGAILRFAGLWEPYGLSIKEALSVLVILVAAFATGSGAGAVAGAVMGMMGSPAAVAPWSAGIMAFAGLVAGAFHRLGKYGTIAGFILGYMIFNLYAGSIGKVAIQVSSLAMALVAFALLPSGVLRKAAEYFSSDSSEEDLINRREIFRDKLYELARLFENLAGALTLPLKEENHPGYFTRVYQKARSEICCECGLQKTCWEREFKATVRAFYELMKCERDTSRDGMPRLFKGRCGRTEEIRKLIRDMNYVRSLELQMDSIVRSHQEMVLKKYKETAGIIRALADGAFPESAGSGIEEKIKNRLSEMGIRVEHVYSVKQADRLQVNIVKGPCIGGRQCESSIPSCVAEALGAGAAIKIVECPLKSGSTRCRLKVVPAGIYRVTVGVVSVPKEGAEVSGDCFSFMELENGKFMLAISDGMGVGEKARQESERTLSILEELLEAGYDHKTALDILNSAMQVARNDDSFSTLDLALIDTYSGQVEFIKAGAVTGFIKRGKLVDTVKGGSLPVGIVDSITASSVKKRLKPGDMIVLLSDGALDSFSDGEDKEAEMIEFLAATNTTNPQELANMILEKVREKKKTVRDDMTVLVGRIWHQQYR